MGKKINGVVLAVTGVVLALGTAGAVPAAETNGKLAAGKNVRTTDATTQPKVKQGAAATNVRINATPGGAVSGSTATGVKVKNGATTSNGGGGFYAKPTVKQGSTPGEKTQARAVQAPQTNPKVKAGATSGGTVAQELIKR